MAFKFEKLKVWQKAVDLSGEIYQLTERFPKKEMFVLTFQIQRASDSIAKKRNLVNDEEFTCFYNFLTELIKSIQALRNSIK